MPNQAEQLGADVNGAAAGDHFGLGIYSNADGSRVAVGGRFNDDGGTNAGHVRVFDWNEATSTWDQVGSDIDGEGAGDEFGWNLSMTPDGSRFVVGGLYHDFGGADRGATYVFDYNPDTDNWDQVGNTIYGQNNGGREGSGTSISTDGNRIATGAYRDTSDNGRLRIFDYNSGTDTWDQVGSDLTGDTNSLFGYQVHFPPANKNRLIVGGFHGLYAGGDGYIEIYDYDGVEWNLVKRLTGPNTEAMFGLAAVMSEDGNRIGVGARYDFSNDGAGRVYDYDYATRTFTQLGGDIKGAYNNEEFTYGMNMSNDGLRLAMGGRYNDTDGYRRGCVRIYDWQPQMFDGWSGGWYQYYPTIYGEAAGDESGHDVHISPDGKRVFVGGPYNDDAGSDAGHFRAYSVPRLFWNQRGNTIDPPLQNSTAGDCAVSLSDDGLRVAYGMDSTNYGVVEVHEYDETTGLWSQMGSTFQSPAFNDDFGRSVALSGDGSILAIGIAGQNNAIGVVQVYEWSGTVWNQLGSDLTGTSANDDFGYAVGLSQDGTRLIVGAPFNDEAGANTGEVKVFDWNGSVWSQVGSDLNGVYNASISDWFGYAVDMAADGLSFVVGAPHTGYLSGTFTFTTGSALIYQWNGSDWAQVGNTIINNSPLCNYGSVVSIDDSGTRVAVSDSFASEPRDGVQIYDYNSATDTWDQVGTGIDGAELEALYGPGSQGISYQAINLSNFGYSVDLSGNGARIVIGAPFANVYNATPDEGSPSAYNFSNGGLAIVYEYDSDAGDWTELGFWRAGNSNDAWQGRGVAISRDGIVFATAAPNDEGHPNYSIYSGSLQVYRQAELGTMRAYDGSDWNTEFVKYWGGTDWFFTNDVRYWNGSSWKSTIEGLREPFSPADLPLSQWLDASDTATITDTAGAVSTWADKSPFGNDVTATGGAGTEPTTGTRTVNGLNVIDFDGLNDFLEDTDWANLSEGSPMTFFIVAQADSVASSQTLFDDGDSVTPVDMKLRLVSGTGSEINAGTAVTSSTSPDTALTLYRASFSVAGVDSVLNIDKTGFTEQTRGDAGTNEVGGITIGSSRTQTEYFDGVIAEFIAVRGLLTDQMVLDMETYLAQKWGLALQFSPLDLSPTLWLDAADTSTITDSGGSVSAWADKSFNGHNLGQLSSTEQPITNSRTLNGLNVIDFVSQDFLTMDTLKTVNQPFHVFMVAEADAIGSVQYLLDRHPSGTNRVEFYYNALTHMGLVAGTSLNGGTPDTNPHVIHLFLNGSSSETNIDGVNEATGTTGTNSFDLMTLGSTYADTAHWDGAVAEVIVVEGSLTTQQIFETEQYLASKWGITI